MCEIDTSVWTRTDIALVVVVAVVAVTAGFVAGYAVHSSSSPPPQTLSITAAGTLGTLFPEVASALANETPGTSAPIAAQTYEGSLAALGMISNLHQPFDVAASADFRSIPLLLEPTWAKYEVTFASTSEVLTYDPSVSAFAGINTTNWAQKIAAPGVRLGLANASVDPNGYNEIFALQLEGLLTANSTSAVYGHFFTSPVGALAVPNPSTTLVEPENEVAQLLATHVVEAYITYQSYAVAHHLSFVPLDPRVNLGELGTPYLNLYSNASTTILVPNGTAVVRGAPVVFAATVPTNAPDPLLGELFLELLLSPHGAALIAGAGFTPITPGWIDQNSAVPDLLASEVAPLPSSLASDIG